MARIGQNNQPTFAENEADYQALFEDPPKLIYNDQ